MRILMFSWEYPPYVVGGLGKHVAELLPPLGDLADVNVDLVTPAWGGGEAMERLGSTTIHRVPPPTLGNDIHASARDANSALEEYALQLWQDGGPFDLIHVHDWLVAFVGVSLKHRHKVPLLSTIHATERGRGHGLLSSDQARSIDQVEWWLAYESWRVIACSEYMASEIESFFQCPRDKIDVIPNGVDTERFDLIEGEDLSRFRSGFALPYEKMIFSVGRVVHEKGLQVLIRAMPILLAEMPSVKAVVAGKGPELDSLSALAQRMGVAQKVLLAGFVSDEHRDRLFKTADCAVFPSLYEPFGIVALEAMAAKCPVIVTEVGGLREVVQHAETGIIVRPDDPASLAWGILHTLQHPDWAAARVENAYGVVREEYNWERIARLTRDFYRQVLAERTISVW